MNESPVLTVDETAKLLRISRGSAFEACRNNSIPNIRIGRRILIPRARLEAMLAGREDASDGANSAGTDGAA